MKKLWFGSLLVLALSLRGETLPVAHAEDAASATDIPSRAYLYKKQKDSGFDTLFFTAVVQQAGRFRFLTCNSGDNAQIPNSPEALATLIQRHCVQMGSWLSDEKRNVGHRKIVHQKKSDRYIYLSSAIYWGTVFYGDQEKIQTDASSTTIEFTTNNKEAINFASSTVAYLDGEIPKISSGRWTELKVYEADILYSKIEETPIEQ